MIRTLLFALAASVLIAAAPPADPDDEAVVTWLEHHGQHLTAPEPTVAELVPIVDRLIGARVIGVGEVTHGTHEDQAFKVALIKELVRAGAIDNVALEANRIAGVRFDRYVRRGEGDPAALVLSPSFFRIWKGDEFAGLLLWLRAWNIAHPVAQVGFVGLDNQDGSVDAGFALDVVARHDRVAAADLRRRFGGLLPAAGHPRIRPSDWIAAHSSDEVVPVLATAVKLRDVLAAHPAWGDDDPDYAEAAYAATVAWQNFDEYALETNGADLHKLPVEYGSRRDRFMTANLLARLGTKGRAALWAHDLHVIGDCPAAWQAKGYTTVGIELKKRLGARYRAIGMTYTQATVLLTRRAVRTSSDMSAPPNEQSTVLSNAGPDAAGKLLSRLPGDAWWFDLSTRDMPGAPAWLSKPTWLGDAGWLADPATFQKTDLTEDAAPFGMGLDVIVWFRTMTPHHRWPGATVVAKRP